MTIFSPFLIYAIFLYPVPLVLMKFKYMCHQSISSFTPKSQRRTFKHNLNIHKWYTNYVKWWYIYFHSKTQLNAINSLIMLRWTIHIWHNKWMTYMFLDTETHIWEPFLCCDNKSSTRVKTEPCIIICIRTLHNKVTIQQCKNVCLNKIWTQHMV